MDDLKPIPPAFPRDHRYDGHNGIDQRAYFAAKALQGLCANPGGPFQANGHNGWGRVNCTNEDVAALAVALADTTILALAALSPPPVNDGGDTAGGVASDAPAEKPWPFTGMSGGLAITQEDEEDSHG